MCGKGGQTRKKASKNFFLRSKKHILGIQSCEIQRMAKLKVYGRVRDRVVLGIVNAYMASHPNATLDELSEAFPNELNATLKGSRIFRDAAETDGMVSCGTKEPGLGILTLANGKRIEMVVQWTDEDYSKLKARAETFGIEVEEPRTDMEIPEEGFKIERMESLSVEAKKENERGEREMTGNQKHLLHLLLTLLLLFTILLFSRGNANDADEIAQYRKQNMTEHSVDLHRLAAEQRRQEKESYERYQDEQVKLAEEIARDTREAFHSLIKQ